MASVLRACQAASGLSSPITPTRRANLDGTAVAITYLSTPTTVHLPPLLQSYRECAVAQLARAMEGQCKILLQGISHGHHAYEGPASRISLPSAEGASELHAGL